MVPTERNEPLAAFLSTRDIPCPGCGYNLRGLTAGYCPECRQRLTLSVSLDEPPIVQFVLAMIGLAACGAAFGMAVLAVLFISVVEKGFPRRDEAVVLFWIPAAIAALDAAAVVVLLRPACRRWFCTRARSGRWLLMLGCWGVSLAAFSAWLTVFFSLR